MAESSDTVKDLQAASFGAAAGEYERGRPTYPAEAVAWLVPETARRVVDLGAGTGKLTRALAAPGREVLAVEPSAGMRAEFARVLPRVPVLAGTGEALPLPDGWADALVCGQAWHWVDPDRAVPEAARVLAPGGQLGLVWNFRDEAEPWVAELDGLLRARGEDRTDHRQLERLEPWFGPLEEHVVRWSHPVTEQQLVDMVASRSYVITMAADERERLLGEVRALVARARPTSLPYVTHCYRARRR